MKTRVVVILLSVIFLAGVFMKVSAMGPSAKQSSPKAAESDEQMISGEQYFSLWSPAGEPLVLADLLKKHKAVLLNFWATWCPYCRKEIPGLISLQERYAKDGLLVIGVDVGEKASKAGGYAADHGVNYPIAIDLDSSVARNYGVAGLPTNILIDSSGKIRSVRHDLGIKLMREIEDALNVKTF